MRKFRCVSAEEGIGFTIDKIYESDDDGFGVMGDDDWVYKSININNLLGVKFEEIFYTPKQLGDYTLNEVKEYCSNQSCDYCDECKFNIICEVISAPKDWDLSDKLILSQSEIDILKAIKVLYMRCNELFYDKDEDVFTNVKNTGLVRVSPDRLPSLSKDVVYSIDELLKEVD